MKLVSGADILAIGESMATLKLLANGDDRLALIAARDRYKRERDALANALRAITGIGWFGILGCDYNGEHEHIDWDDPDTRPILDRLPPLIENARAAIATMKD